MVSRYGVSKEGAVGVAVGVGPMHCLLPHCGGPHHHHHLSAPHPQNPQPGHNHHVHPAHQPPPSPSPHLNHQLSHHQLTVNINHLSHQQQQQQQTQHQQAPPQYRVVTANARSDFHVSGQNYGTQPGGQVGGGGGSVGVPGGRGPPPLGGLQSIGQSAAGIPPGGPAGGQAPPQTPAPGVQSQPPQGPAPTTTPPVHTPSPQEMGKQAHLQPQPQPLSQVYGPTQTRPTSQGFYQGPRPQQPRGISHRGGQGGTGAQVVGMSGVGGGGGQPTTLYHPGGLPVQTGAMYQVPNLHPGPHQQSLYTMNSQMPLQFGGPPQRHQTHQNQSYFPPFQHSAILTAQNMFGYGAPAPTPQPYYWSTGQPPNTPLSLSRAATSAVTGGAQHVAGPLAGAQGAPVVPQGTLQQPTQQAQALPPLGISLSQPDVYSGHNGGATGTTSNTMKSRKPRGQNAITDIVDPTTGKNISHEIYKDNETIQSGESSNRETPQPQNNDAEVQADFAARVAKTLEKVVTEESSPDSMVPTCVPNTSTTQNVTQNLSNSQANSTNDVNSQCSTSSPTTQNIPNVTSLCSQSLGTTSTVVVQIDYGTMNLESKPLQISVKEFQPRSEPKSVVIEEPPPAAQRNVNKDDISAQLPATTVTDVEVKSTGATPTTTQTSVPVVTIPSTNVPEVPKPSATAPSANPVPAREPFPNSSNKNSSSSPPRRKSQSHAHNQPAVAAGAAAATVTELPSSAKEQKEKKTREKSLSSTGTTPTPAQTEHHLKANGDATGDKLEPEPARTEIQQQKSSDGKAMQKQKSKNKFKPRDLNRKGAEKEGTDMDAFVNTIPPTKSEIKQDIKDSLPPKDSNKESSREITKDNYESKKEKEVTSVHTKTEKQTTPVSPEIPKESTPIQAPVIEKLPSNKETIKESSPKIEDSNKSNVCNMPPKSVPNDVVDHEKVKEELNVEAIVAQKNEENSKVSAIRTPNEEKPQASPVIEKSVAENESAVGELETGGQIVTNQIQLKYKYKEDQWSPINKSGKKVYDREFLMKLLDDPSSKIKPSNLPDLDVVLKESSKARTTVDLRPFKDMNMNRHDVLFPGFTKTNLNTRVLATNKNKSHSGGRSSSAKPSKPNVIHMSFSLREDVKLRETENAWRPTRLKTTNISEEEAKTEALYKRVRSVLNKLTPQKFNTLVDQVRALNIDTPERLQGVIDLVFEKAVDEPSFSVAYALMCKELAVMGVSGANKNSDNQESSFNFKKLIIERCQKEFEKNPENELARASKLKEIEECTDPERKKDLQLALEEEERRIRIKSVGNIRFIGELYKQEMLTGKIMRRCIDELLRQNDEDSLECACKLLTTIGKDLESKGNPEEMQDYFNKIHDIVSRRGQGKISSRIRFMLQDVIDLRANKWIPRRDDSNPKTIDQIQKEAESERLDSQLSNTPLNTPRKDERTNDRKRNRGVGPTDEGGWSQPVVRTRQPYSVETAKLKNKPPPMDDLQLGSRNAYMWKLSSNCSSKTMNSNKFACLENITILDHDKRITSPQLSGSRSTGPREYGRDYKLSYDGRSSRNGSHQLSISSSSRESSLLDSSQGQSVSMPPSLKSSQSTSSSRKPPMTEEEFIKTLNKIMKDYLKNPVLEKVTLAIQQNFDNSLTKFIRDLINFVLEKSNLDREHVSYLLSHLINQKVLPVQNLRLGFIEILESIDDLLLDIPKVWLYLAEILSQSVEDDLIPLGELKPVFDKLKSRGYVGKFLGELLMKLSQDKGPKWVADKWEQSGLQLSNIIDPKLEEIDKITKDYDLNLHIGVQPTLRQIHDELRKLMKESNFDVICDWIIANVGNRVKEPEFIRVLTTAILETSMEPANNRWNLKVEHFINLQQLIRRFVDANESLELQCLYAIQLHLHNLQYPHGVLFNIMTNLSDYNIISSDAFLTWRKTPEPAQREWHGVAAMALTSFFTGLQEADDASSVEDVSTSVNQDHC